MPFANRNGFGSGRFRLAQGAGLYCDTISPRVDSSHTLRPKGHVNVFCWGVTDREFLENELERVRKKPWLGETWEMVGEMHTSAPPLTEQPSDQLTTMTQERDMLARRLAEVCTPYYT